MYLKFKKILSYFFKSETKVKLNFFMCYLRKNGMLPVQDKDYTSNPT